MMTALVCVSLAALAGGAAQALSGFGFALVAVPVLDLALGPRAAVVVVTLASLILTVGVTVRERRHVERTVATRLIGTALVGMPAGLVALVMVPSRVLGVVMSVVAVGFAVLAVVRGHRRRAPGRLAGPVAGVLSGAALTSTGMNGPPLVAFMHGLDLAPARQRATLQATFTVQDLAAMSLFAVAGHLPGQVWLLGLAAVPGAALGWAAGDRLFHRLDPRRARHVVLVALLGTASILLARSIS
jgi:uncharacterized membrane protein YfcA